ncbi:dendritic cell-specific transmembrane protein-like [Chanos chanos]|uniref:Dendritic cell-specific transmembrane protein-like n=1 Tax=Chanos chanos TaxID=29144 RepID=A0A6J2WLX6_CHACN|nr:dendritic cell-specific transmembrane protein-like [Chanos chanos]
MARNCKQSLMKAWSTVTLLYTSGHKTGWRYVLLHLLVCFAVSLLLSLLLHTILFFSFKNDMVVSGGITAGCAIAVTTALFLSRRVRCFALLFLVACAMRQGRNLLLMAGTSLVIFWNMKNTYQNLQKIAQSLLCNIQKKKELLDVSPLDNYVRMLKWIKKQLKDFSDLGVVKFETDLRVWPELRSKETREKLEKAKETMKEIEKNVQNSFDVVLSVGEKILPFMGIILVLIVTTLFLKRFAHNKKYKNKFITRKFVEYDERQKAEGKPHVLPLTKKEAKRYITIPSANLRTGEVSTMVTFFVPVGIQVLTWLFLIGLDGLLYWIIITLNKHLAELEPFSIPIKMTANSESKFLGIHVSGNTKVADFSYSVSLFEKECVPEPTLMLSNSVIPVSMIAVVLVILGLLSSKLVQLQSLVSEEFYTDSASERVEHLHAKIVRKRSRKPLRALKNTLMSFGKNKKFWFPILYRTKKEEHLQLS